MSTVAFPYEDPSSWDTVELGGIALPGHCRVSVTRSYELDVKKPKGKSHASITYQGTNPAKVTIDVFIWTPQQYKDLRAAFNLIAPQADGPDGVPIVHPKCTFWNVPSVFIENFSDPANNRSDEMTIQISCVEFRKASKTTVTKTPKGLDPRTQILGDDIPNAPEKPSAGNTAP